MVAFDICKMMSLPPKFCGIHFPRASEGLIKYHIEQHRLFILHLDSLAVIILSHRRLPRWPAVFTQSTDATIKNPD